MEIDERPVLTDKEVADLLAVPASTVRHLHRVGALRGVCIARHLRWLRSSVDAYLRKLAEAVIKRRSPQGALYGRSLVTFGRGLLPGGGR